MGLEGAVKLGFRKELEAITAEGEREERIRELTALAEENAKALNAATLFELDDVIDPAETRAPSPRRERMPSRGGDAASSTRGEGPPGEPSAWRAIVHPRRST